MVDVRISLLKETGIVLNELLRAIISYDHTLSAGTCLLRCWFLGSAPEQLGGIYMRNIISLTFIYSVTQLLLGFVGEEESIILIIWLSGVFLRKYAKGEILFSIFLGGKQERAAHHKFTNLASPSQTGTQIFALPSTQGKKNS